MRNIFFFFLTIIIISCNESPKPTKETVVENNGVSLVVLGTTQDGGSPHIGCKKTCCEDLFKNPDKTRKVVSLGLIDSETQKTYILEATPDFTEQIKTLNSVAPFEHKETPDGIFITHAHIGHYTGLMYLGKEALGANGVATYVMEKMDTFLRTNGPWSQLVSEKNILLNEMQNDKPVVLSKKLSIEPLLVPHRDEYSETVGFLIKGEKKKVLFIPDIDKWSKWDTEIVQMVKVVDFAFLDATFYDAAEINNRDISLIPHPFVIESMQIMKGLKPEDKKKVHFIHFNHTNPLLNKSSDAYKTVIENGFNVSQYKEIFKI
ncbi:MAG: MBL fold metallo-hydrolase [Saprospiraceae bacterium]|nr:MBL fold metallo-hydrolase [Bacteroidia bacterium]NNE15043.1 MBL fold metallo-hydrolase [Saprospiraceae bacterium]